MAGAAATLLYTATGDKWAFNKPLDVTGSVTSSGTLTANAGVVVDNITIDGQKIDLSSGDLTLDVAGSIKLDADSSNIYLADGGADIGLLSTNNQDINIRNLIADKDIYFQGNDSDNGGNFTALTLDMSAAGNATFSGNVTTGATLLSTNAIVDNLIVKTSSGSMLVKTNAGANIARFNNVLTTDLFGSLDVTGNITVSGTVDGVDLQTLNTTAGAALPKAGGTMTGTLVVPAVTVGNSSIGSNSSHLANITINNNGYIGTAYDSTSLNFTTAGDLVATGKVGIGTPVNTAPGSPLTISNLDNGTSFSSNRVLQLVGTSTTDGSRVSLAFSGNTGIGNGLAIIEAVNDDQSAGHTSLHMHTYDGSWNTENLVLKGGNVGIGNAAPAGKLHIQSGDAGTVTPSSQADDLVVEASTEGGITIMTPDDQSARIRFTSPSTESGDEGGADIFYRQNINKMSMGTTVSGGILAFKSGAGNESLALASSGAATFSGEVLIPEKLSHAGDTDTHFKFAGADDIRIVAGGVDHAAFDGTIVFNQSGSSSMDFRVESDTQEHMLFVDASLNRIGIANNAPATTLDVTGTVTATSLELAYAGATRQQADSQALSIITPASGGGQGIAFKRLDSNNDQALGEISWSNNTQDGQANIRVKTEGAVNSTDMHFDVNNAGTLVTAMSIDGSAGGKVGIGVSDPDSKLEIKGAGGGTGLTFKTTDVSDNETFYIQDGGGVGVRYYPLKVGIPSGTATATNAVFQVEEAGLLTVLTTGKVGIGTTIPNAPLSFGVTSVDSQVA